MAQVIALSLARDYGAPVETRDALTLVTGVGIDGDRHAGNVRQVTVVCTGELAKAAADLGTDSIDGLVTRRNIVVDAETLPRQHGTRFTIGTTELEVWRDCAPCSLMDELFGAGAREAMKLRAGISATVVGGGVIRVGDITSL